MPRHIADDFAEACAVLNASPKASAALSRRCLQIILTDHGYAGANLAKQVEAVLNETDSSKSLPSGVHTVVDLVRNFGNFSAHPIPDKTSQTIIDVEPEEAETCLDILEALFDHYYVRPAAAKRMKDVLNAKLATAGKPPAK